MTAVQKKRAPRNCRVALSTDKLHRATRRSGMERSCSATSDKKPLRVPPPSAMLATRTTPHNGIKAAETRRAGRFKRVSGIGGLLVFRGSPDPCPRW